jgi:hypothetical protein
MTDMRTSTLPGKRRGFYIAYPLNSDTSTTPILNIASRHISETRVWLKNSAECHAVSR